MWVTIDKTSWNSEVVLSGTKEAFISNETFLNHHSAEKLELVYDIINKKVNGEQPATIEHTTDENEEK